MINLIVLIVIVINSQVLFKRNVDVFDLIVDFYIKKMNNFDLMFIFAHKRV